MAGFIIPAVSETSEVATELSRTLANLQSAGDVEVCEDGERLAELAKFQFEVRRQGRATFVHLWSDERNLVRRVLRVAEDAPGRLVLEVQRFGKSKPGRLEFLSSAGRPAGRISREKFRARFRRLLLTQFPDEEVESLTSAPDLEHSFSGSYTRGITRRGQCAWAVLGVSSAEDTSTIDAALTFGLLWLDWTRGHAEKKAIKGLRLILPEGSARVAAHRLQAIVSDANIELYELNEAAWRLRRIDPRDAGNLLTWLTPRREAEDRRAAAKDVIERVMSLAPGAVDAIVPPGTREVVLRFHGLEFARWRGGRLRVVPLDDARPRKSRRRATLETLVKELATFRHPLATDRNHPLYRVAAERWLESLALHDISTIDARLDPRHVYPQVPALSGSGPDSMGAGRGVIDLLGVTREGRLAVIELKASEDLHLALQGMDYWLRVRWHLQQGDFPRYGYFSGVELQDKPPLLYLVAPGFRFHPATDTLLRYILPEVECVRVGLNEDWRCGLKVVFRQ
jgi:hypothetical protein